MCTHIAILYLSISIYIYLYLPISIYIYLYLSKPIYIYLYLSISIYIYLYLSISIYIYLYLPISIYIYLYLSISLYIYLYLSIRSTKMHKHAAFVGWTHEKSTSSLPQIPASHSKVDFPQPHFSAMAPPQALALS